MKAIVGKCPGCNCILTATDTENRRCLACHRYLFLSGESPKDVALIRNQKMLYIGDLVAYHPENPVNWKPLLLINAWNGNVHMPVLPQKGNIL